MITFVFEPFKMKNNKEKSDLNLGSIRIKKIPNSRTLSDIKEFTNLEKIIKSGNFSLEKFVNPNLVSEGLIRRYKKENKKRKRFFGLF